MSRPGLVRAAAPVAAVVFALSLSVATSVEGGEASERPALTSQRAELPVAIDTAGGMRPWTRTFTSLARATVKLSDAGAARLGAAWPDAPVGLVWLGGLGRFLLIDAAATSFAVIANHELFGHGYRAREAAASPEYEVAPPPPWPWLLGMDDARNWTSWEGEDAMSPDRRLLLQAGGIEAQEVQQRQIAFDAFRRGRLERAEGLIYLWCALDLVRRVSTTNTDMTRYDRWYDMRHATGMLGPGPTPSETERARRWIAVATMVADPMLWMAFRAFLNTGGTRDLPSPTLEVGGLRWSGTVRWMPVPWGREHRVDVMVGDADFALDVQARLGFGHRDGSWGAGLKLRDVRVFRTAYGGLVVGADVDAWSQPELELAPLTGVGVLGGPAKGPAQRLGFAAAIKPKWVAARFSVGVVAGWKSAGFATGLPVRAGAWGWLELGVAL